MDGTPCPYYMLKADAPNEKGFLLHIRISTEAGGPLDGLTEFGVIDYLRDYLASQPDVTIQLSKYEISTTTGL